MCVPPSVTGAQTLIESVTQEPNPVNEALHKKNRQHAPDFPLVAVSILKIFDNSQPESLHNDTAKQPGVLNADPIQPDPTRL